jgi:hypothetical protein
MVTIGDQIHVQDLIGRRGTPRSNRDRRLEIGQRRRLLLQLYSAGETKAGGRHGHQLGRAQARATGHQTRWSLTLHDIEDEGNPFCKLTATETIEGERATMMRFSRRLVMVRMASSSAPASRSSSTASPCSPQAPHWVNCFGHRWIKLVRRLSSCAWVCGLRDKIRRVWATIYRASWSYS